jgi:hypothetical protein
MNAPTDEIDWEEAERRERRRDLVIFPGIVAFFVGMVLLTGDFWLLTGSAAWAVVAVFLGFIMLMTAASHLIPRLRRKGSAGYRIQAALRRHLDPGPELRARADRQARYVAGTAWVGWVALLPAFAFLLGGQWERPMLAAPGAVLLVGAALAWVMWWRSRVHVARRWVADPPGPPREALPPTTAERWLTGRRGLTVVAGLTLGMTLLVLMVVLGVVLIGRP